MIWRDSSCLESEQAGSFEFKSSPHHVLKSFQSLCVFSQATVSRCVKSHQKSKEARTGGCQSASGVVRFLACRVFLHQDNIDSEFRFVLYVFLRTTSYFPHGTHRTTCSHPSKFPSSSSHCWCRRKLGIGKKNYRISRISLSLTFFSLYPFFQFPFRVSIAEAFAVVGEIAHWAKFNLHASFTFFHLLQFFSSFFLCRRRCRPTVKSLQAVPAFTNRNQLEKGFLFGIF